MKIEMVMLKPRFEYVQKAMGERVEMIKEETDTTGSEWVYFSVNVDWSFDMLDFFHAGVQCGFDSRGGKLF